MASGEILLPSSKWGLAWKSGATLRPPLARSWGPEPGRCSEGAGPSKRPTSLRSSQPGWRGGGVPCTSRHLSRGSWLGRSWWPKDSQKQQPRSVGCLNSEAGGEGALLRGFGPRGGPQLWGSRRQGHRTGGGAGRPAGAGPRRALLCDATRPRQAPPLSVLGKGTLQDAGLSPWAKSQHRGDCSSSIACRRLAPKPAARPMSRVARKAEALADPCGAETPSLATGQRGLPASSHLFRPPVRPPVCPEVSGWHPGHPGLQGAPASHRPGAWGPRPRPGLRVLFLLGPQFAVQPRELWCPRVLCP